MFDQNELDILDIITILSFVIQLQNNDELQKQTSNDEILKRLHEDVMMVMEENRQLSDIIIEQNNLIIDLLKGKNEHES